VWDTGIGIPADRLEPIFDEFYQVNPGTQPANAVGGLGLGLSIVKRLAALLNARLQVRSTVGRGSMFSITVHRCEPAPLLAPDEPPEEVIAEQADWVARKVLVIDDDPMVLQAMQRLL